MAIWCLFTATSIEAEEHHLLPSFLLMCDVPINADERKYSWPLGQRPDDHAGLSDLGL